MSKIQEAREELYTQLQNKLGGSLKRHDGCWSVVSNLSKKKNDILFECIEEKTKARGFEDLLADDELCRQGTQYKELQKKAEKQAKKCSKLQNEIERHKEVVETSSGSFKFKLTGSIMWNYDAHSFMFEHDAEITAPDGREYLWWNVFDAGDVLAKKGQKAWWYCKEHPMDKECRKYDDKDVKNIQKIVTVLNIGVRM